MRGLVIGRFQPFHSGHEYLIEEITEDVDELIVGIGSAGQSHTTANPFTSGERVQMVDPVIEPLETRCYSIPIPDIDRNAMWVSHIATLCPAFDVIYTNNPFVERLFGESGFDVRGTPLHRRDVYRGSEIRRRMLAGEEWAHLVPDPVTAVVKEVDGVARLRAISRDDEPAQQ
jgi:nicotinamide-nucleotide adenylyltransferase